MDFKALIKGIRSVQDTMQGKAAHAINTTLTVRNWLIGCYIVEFEQNGEDRASYGEKLLKNLEDNLNTKGLDERRLREFRRFYIVYPQLNSEISTFIPTDTQIRHLLSAELQNEDNQIDKWIVPAEKILYRLSYTHLRKIIPIENPVKRAFYEMETIKGCWSVAELEWQISSLYFERSGLSQNKEALSAMANQKAVNLRPKDIINTPVVLKYTRKAFASYVFDEHIESLCSNVKIYADKLSLKTLHSIKIKNELSNIDVSHFGWNIWNHFRVGKQIDIAYFLKQAFPDIFKDVEVETIKKHLKDDELKGIIKIQESIALLKVSKNILK